MKEENDEQNNRKLDDNAAYWLIKVNHEDSITGYISGCISVCG